MQVFVYELVTGGGAWGQSGRWLQASSLVDEAKAMVDALVADLVRVPGASVACMRDERMGDWRPRANRVIDVGGASEEDQFFRRLAADADWTIVIAPEFGGMLLSKCRQVETVGGRLVGPQSHLVELASDKHALCLHLARCGIKAPHGMLMQAGQPWPHDFNYPAVWKPRYGAGSVGITTVSDAHAPIMATEPDAPFDLAHGRLEEWCPGAPASVAVLCGPAGVFTLPACSQQLSDDGRLQYLGGTLVLPAGANARASRLAHRAVSTLPNPCGYLGVDLILGDQADGGLDVVIEINPRLTTSYVGLRALCLGNLASAMLAAASGLAVDVGFGSQRLAFTPEGTVLTLTP